jgi:BirA family biotin operon repressor/biotin-[acetyl-CoA-carboxylase] ligase
VTQSVRNVALDQVGSTNREALALAETGETGPLWIMARRQTAGRGRADRHWVSAPGNLHASLLIRLECPPAATPQLSLLAGVAVIDAIRQAAGRAGPPGLRLKWPNDILIGQAKCAGILVETSGPPPQRQNPPPRRAEGAPPKCGEGLGGNPTSDVLQSPHPVPPHKGEGTLRRASYPNSGHRYAVTAVIGIGINLAWHPDDLGRTATHLAKHGYRISADAMLGSLAEAMQRWLATWDCGRGFAGVRSAWLERAGPAGEKCTVDTGRERIAGMFVDLDAEGALVICDGHGQRRTVTFGDVTLVAAAPQEAS